MPKQVVGKINFGPERKILPGGCDITEQLLVHRGQEASLLDSLPPLRVIEKEVLRREKEKLEVEIKAMGADDLDDLPALARLASRLEPAARRAFLAAVLESQAAIQLEALADAILRNQTVDITEQTQTHILRNRLINMGFKDAIASGFLRGAEFAHEELAKLNLNMNFNLINPHAVAFSERHIPRLVDSLVDGAERNIQRLITASFRDGIPPMRVARQIRNYIGLTDRDSRTSANFEQRLIDEGVNLRDVDRRVAMHAQRMVNRRAKTIARTEIMRAHNFGQDALWRESMNQGLLNKDDTFREWIITPDDRLDLQICERMDGVQVPFKDYFSVPTVGDLMNPPAHPNCRCTVGLVFKTEEPMRT